MGDRHCLFSRRPVIIEVPHFAALRNKEREIVILRSDNGESWKEHTLEATEDAVQDVLQESFDADEMNQIEDLNTNRITRILTTDFPQYFAIVSRIRQEVHAIGPQGGVVNSTVVPQVQAVFPQGALTKKIKVGLQVSTLTPGTQLNTLKNPHEDPHKNRHEPKFEKETCTGLRISCEI